MEKFEIIITTLFGLESLVAREVRRLGYETTSVEDVYKRQEHIQ